MLKKVDRLLAVIERVPFRKILLATLVIGLILTINRVSYNAEVVDYLSRAQSKSIHR